MRRLVLFTVLSLSLACGAKLTPQPVQVEVPVLVKQAPPPELLAPLAPDLPTFVVPTDPAASSALSVEDERLMRALINDLLARIHAWEAWAATPLEEK